MASAIAHDGLSWEPSRAPAYADEAAAKKWIDERVPAFDAHQGRADEGDAVVHQCREAVRRHGDQRRLRDHHHARIRVQGAGQGLHRDHRHQGHARHHPGRRRRREDPDPDAVGPQHLRRLDQRFRPDRHALPLQPDGLADRLDGGRRQGRHPADARRRRLHRQVVRHRARRQALPAARPAVREPLLVPLRLVHQPRLQGASSRPSTATSSACR